MDTPPSSPQRMTLDVLLERFTSEVRAGNSPEIAKYVRRYPHLAEEIEELFPIIEGLEKCKVAQDADFVRQNFPAEFPLRQLGECTLVREIGRGGMGLVFEAVQASMERTVAIKLLPTRFFANRLQSKERFQREAVTIARLKHQNIVPIYSFGEHDGYYFYVMQLVRGVSLDWVIRQLRSSPTPICTSMIQRAGGGDVSVADTLRAAVAPPNRKLTRHSWTVFAKIGIQVASGISHAHEHGVLHQDIKPANLLLNLEGRVVITDFGGSYLPDSTVTPVTEFHTGTLRYMAPERLEGHSDQRSDVYSIGVTLYELVTQHSAFDVNDQRQLAELILNPQLPPPRKLCKEIPAEFERIIMKALARNPDVRYPSAKLLADDLRRFVK
ncbi:MAG: serine/threonine protein kinase [Planctomycetaceae bacterium]|nr:serine/threonine protein kinase [Planctomycetaceae bacterium]